MVIDDLLDFTRSLLNEPLPNTTDGLKARLRALSQAREPILTAKVNAHKLLAEKRGQFLHPKDKELTDVDRRIRLEEATAAYQAEFELLSGLDELLSESVSIISAILTS